MATVYILYSRYLGSFYIGSCDDLNARYKDHITTKYSNSFTAKASDWEIVFRIEDLQYAQARKIEDHIKKMKSKNYIKNLLKYPEMVEKLKVRYG